MPIRAESIERSLKTIQEGATTDKLLWASSFGVLHKRKIVKRRMGRESISKLLAWVSLAHLSSAVSLDFMLWSRH